MFYQKSLPSRELTYPTWGKGKSSSKMPFLGDMLVPWRVYSWVGCHPFFCCPTQRPGFCCGSTEPNYPPLGPPNGQAHLGRCVSGNVTITYAVETGAPVLFPGFLVIPWFLFHILLRKHQSTPGNHRALKESTSLKRMVTAYILGCSDKEDTVNKIK